MEARRRFTKTVEKRKMTSGIIMDEDIFSKDVFSGTVFLNEPMGKHTTLRLGGTAEVYALPEDVISLKNLMVLAGDRGLPVLPLGGGSNILITDGGLEGVVVSLASFKRMDNIEDTDNRVRLFVEAGVPLPRLISLAKEKGYKGLEGLTGIPGFVGGAIRGNAGSFGYAIGDVIESVALMDHNGGISMFETKALNFGYRTCNIPGGSIILSAIIRLKKDNAPDVAERTNVFLREKLSKQPVSEHSAGCVFKNPARLYAGALIEQAGCKGLRRGDIEVSRLHANFFINMGKGTASDFLSLMEDVKERVRRSSDLELEEEIRILGRV